MAHQPTRRDFLRTTSAAAAAGAIATLTHTLRGDPVTGTRPNFVLFVGEDMSPDCGCYGNAFSRTPHLDKLAAQGIRYNNCFTHCGVCAPSRSGMITGQYPTTIGTHHMRSRLLKPPRPFTRYLQEAGYKINWTNKCDFNFDDATCGFDLRTDWTAGDLPTEPFFVYFNDSRTHESQVRGTPEMHAKNTAQLKASDRQDPAKLPLPPFFPDLPEVRNDVRRYHELCTAVDYNVGQVMDMLEKKGVADNTIFIFTGDHGRGMPRMKRWVYDDGTRIPLIIRWPKGIRPGTVSDDLVGMIDLPATVLSLAGVALPKSFQGVPYLGEGAKNREHVFAHRDRMDETFDRIRSVRDRQYRYVRNYAPEVPYAQYINYNEENPIMKAMRREARAGRGSPELRQFFAKTKPAEELYDCHADPHNVHNIIDSKESSVQAKLVELRKALDQWIADTNDLGAIPEADLVKRGLVADRLTEYNERLKDHPAEPPYVQ